MPAQRGARPEIRAQAAERKRQVVALRIRGISFEAIGRQLGFSRQVAHKLFIKALRDLPPSVKASDLRRLEDERIAEMRARCWTELSGREVRRPDPENPGKYITITERPDTEAVTSLINTLVRLSRHEAMLHGLDAPTKVEANAAIVGARTSDEELDIKLARLTPDEQDQFMVLIRKLEGRYVEPPAIEDNSSVETSATPLADSPN
jgi:hypothetical protein